MDPAVQDVDADGALGHETVGVEGDHAPGCQAGINQSLTDGPNQQLVVHRGHAADSPSVVRGLDQLGVRGHSTRQSVLTVVGFDTDLAVVGFRSTKRARQLRPFPIYCSACAFICPFSGVHVPHFSLPEWFRPFGRAVDSALSAIT